MTIPQAKAIHKLLSDDQWLLAANTVLGYMGKDAVVDSKPKALKFLQQLFQHLLDNEEYLVAATLQWGPNIFLAEPESVRREFKAMHENAKILVMGGSSLGKSYAIGAWMALDYLRDPLYTSVKLAAVSEKHLKENLYPHVAKLIKNLVIPCVYKIEFKESDLWMGIKEAGFEFGISGLAFKQSQETSGQFKGYKAMPVSRKNTSKLGNSSRLRMLVDEAQNVPGGPFQDMNSLIASISGVEKIKIVCAFNPENTSCRVVQMAEPEQGWNIEELETLYDYESKSGWRVCRLDAARCENVIQKKMVYENLQSYEGFMGYLKAGGDNSAAYFCFARGFPPVVGTVNTIIPPAWPQSQRGEATFIDNPQVCAAIDLAFMGKDTAQMAYGRWGLASGWRDHLGAFQTFKDRLDVSKPKPRHVLQIDVILPLSKHDDTVKMAEEIMGKCKMLGIPPEWVSIDKTGYGFGTWSHLNKVWGEVHGIAWNEKATERKIISEDMEGADKQCDGVMSEMWWAFRKWLDPRCGAILINPIVPSQPIHTQLTSRRYKTGKNGIKVEAKEEYMARNTSSPDEADACFVAGTMVRTASGDKPIEDIEVGEWIETPFGITPVAIKRENIATDMIWLNFSDGAVIAGTASHKFFTWNDGWKRADALSLTNEMESVSNLGLWKSLNLSSIPIRPIGFKQLVDITKMVTKLRPKDFYIEPSGLISMAQSRTECISIIKTKIGRIIHLITSKFSRHHNTSNTIGKQGGNSMKPWPVKEKPEERRLSLSPQLGTPQLKGWHGIQKMERALGLEEQNIHQNALSAEDNSKHTFPATHSSVPKNVQTRGLIEKCRMKIGVVLYAAARLLPKKECQQRPVPLSVVPYTATEPVKVYNLTLQNHNAYYANGILVQNCVMLVHLVRKNSDVIPGLVDEQRPTKDGRGGQGFVFTSVGKMATVDVPESIYADGQDEY